MGSTTLWEIEEMYYDRAYEQYRVTLRNTETDEIRWGYVA